MTSTNAYGKIMISLIINIKIRRTRMRSNKVVKLIGLNLSIIIGNIVLFSDGFFGIHILGGSAFQTAFGITAVLMSIMIFAVGNFSIINRRRIVEVKPIAIRSAQECITALKRQYHKQSFSKDIDMIVDQTTRFSHKRERIEELIVQKFSTQGLSYSKFESVLNEFEQLYYMNVQSILNRINVFDEADYIRMKKYSKQERLLKESYNSFSRKFSKEFLEEKMSVYGEYFSFVNNAIEDNEQMLLKLDQLNLELSKFTSLEEGELEQTIAMKEIDDLIGKTKLYK